MSPRERSCAVSGCELSCRNRRQRCDWHWLLKQDIETQARAADWRRGLGRTKPPRAEWPEGWRWCSGCSSMVPLFFCSGSRCRACERLARRGRHVQATYGLSGSEERALKAWQGGKCFICGRRAVTRELAVDHDHESGAVRGLLCSDDQFGCNVLLRRILGDPGAAERLVAYVTKWPLDRMRDGEPPWSWASRSVPQDDSPPPF